MSEPEALPALPCKYHALSPQQRRQVREEYIKRQKGLCMFCETSLEKSPPNSVARKKINWGLFPKNFLRHPVHLQHNHRTGLTEGAVHSLCNAVMWQYHGR